jgi:signal transduction histidine kinase
MFKPFKTETSNYTFYGVLFGFLFPIGATLVDSINSYGSLTWSNSLKAQFGNPLIWIIDTAPFWLGLFARLGGIRQDDLIKQKSLVDEEVKRKTEEIKKALNESKKANQAKSEFLARMSHELRTPMNAILGFTQLLDMDKINPLTDLQKKNLAMVSSAGNHLLELINEVLDLSGIESGKMKLSFERVDIIPIVENIVSISKSLAEEKGVSVEYQNISEDSLFVQIDPLRFKQAMLNLVSNAIKYNKPHGSVLISYENISSDRMRIGIKDTGNGIPEDKKDKLFESFERFDVDKEYIEGTGIGLTITKQLIELMNGTIGFESNVNQGSFFYIDIPISVKARAVQFEEKEE